MKSSTSPTSTLSFGADSVITPCSAEGEMLTTFSSATGSGCRSAPGSVLNPASVTIRSGAGRLVTTTCPNSAGSVGTPHIW